MLPTSEVMEAFLNDRNEALLSLDIDKINAYLRKYGSPELSNDEVGWRAIHKARTAITAFSESERQKSRDWLAEHQSEAWG